MLDIPNTQLADKRNPSGSYCNLQTSFYGR